MEKIVRPFQDFAEKQSSGSILLITATVAALVRANSPWGEGYAALWHTKLTVGVGELSLSKDLTHWINDGLMAIFFLVVGLEIKREVLVGELSSVRGAALPVAVAVGRATVPALIYLAFNLGSEGVAGWGIPMATDIAFALGVLALLGERVPVVLKVSLTALFSWLAVRSGLAELPEGIGWRHIYGVGWLAGTGFTMSLFISDLAFSDGALVNTAKLGILAASLISGVVGWTQLRRATSLRQDDMQRPIVLWLRQTLQDRQDSHTIASPTRRLNVPLRDRLALTLCSHHEISTSTVASTY